MPTTMALRQSNTLPSMAVAAQRLVFENVKDETRPLAVLSCWLAVRSKRSLMGSHIEASSNITNVAVGGNVKSVIWNENNH